MDDHEKRLSDYIDALNAEQEPEKHYGPADSPELEKTLAAVRLVRTLREPALPDPGYPQRLSQRVAERIKVPGSSRRWILPAVAALAACLCLFVFF